MNLRAKQRDGIHRPPPQQRGRAWLCRSGSGSPGHHEQHAQRGQRAQRGSVVMVPVQAEEVTPARQGRRPGGRAQRRQRTCCRPAARGSAWGGWCPAALRRAATPAAAGTRTLTTTAPRHVHCQTRHQVSGTPGHAPGPRTLPVPGRGRAEQKSHRIPPKVHFACCAPSTLTSQ